MKKVYKDKILNIDQNIFDNKFSFDYLIPDNSCSDIEVFFMEKLLKSKENTELLNNLWDKYAIYSNVYSPEDELEIFKNLFDYAITNNKKIHIVWITLKEETDILEEYYTKLWFLREDINAFKVDFSKVLVSASVKIENLIWKWSDYKAQRKNIFFIPPVRESWQNRAMFKAINRWTITWIQITDFSEANKSFLQDCITWENILPLLMAKVLCFNLEDIGLKWEKKELVINY